MLNTENVKTLALRKAKGYASSTRDRSDGQSTGFLKGHVLLTGKGADPW